MTYDTGFVRNGEISRARFDPEVVRRELAIIRDDLHCTAVQLIGGDPERPRLTASYATELGLEVWFSPYPLELTAGEILSLFADCAERAERLRQGEAEVVFVTGAPARLNGEYVRDEDGQAAYLGELLEIFDTEGVDSAFVFLFALENLPHRPDGDPRHDPDMAWEPKAAFFAVAECYRGCRIPTMGQ